MLSLAHISDIHLGPLPKVSTRELMSKRITGYLNWKLNRKGVMQDGVLDGLIAHMHEQAPDHIAVTGDLINLALNEEIEIGSKWLATLGAADNVSFVPGNHDAYVMGSLNRVIRAVAPFMTGDSGQIEPPFPFRRVRKNVSLIGVNSGRASAPLLATGVFDKAQEKATRTMLDEDGKAGRFRVVLIHHPPFKNATAWSKRLIGARRFRKMIREVGAELILHGHTHIDSYEHIAGPNGDVPVIGVPSASKAPATELAKGHKHPAARYNLFSIEETENVWSCGWDEYGYQSVTSGVELIEKHHLWDKGVLVKSSNRTTS